MMAASKPTSSLSKQPEDSPTCMNFDSKDNPGPCTECLLIQFVPPEHCGQKIPCRHIPLNEAAETPDSLYRTGTQGELEEALGSWLRATIKRLEGERTRQSGLPAG